MRPEDDLISLVDLAVIFVRRWVAFVTVFLLVLASGIGYALTLKDVSTVVYTTTVQPAAIPGKENGTALIIMFIENKWIVEAEEEYKERYGTPPVPITPQKAQEARLIELVSRGPNRQKQAVVDFHQVLAERIVREQNARLDSQMGMFEQQLEDIEAIISRAENLPKPEDIRMRLHIRNNIQFGEAAEILSLAHRRIAEEGPSAKKVMILSGVFGLLLGCLAPFVVEFVCQVRLRLRELRAERNGS